METMLEEVKCPMCGGWYVMELTREQKEKLTDYRYACGKAIQELFPEFDRVEREFLKTGYCPECQEMIFGNGKTDKIKKAERFYHK